MLIDPPLFSTISHADFVDAYQALAFANHRGFIVDAALDVTWSQHGIMTDEAVAQAHRRLLIALDTWLTMSGQPPFYLWALERGDRFRLHTHITLHLPAAHDEAARAFLDPMLAGVVCGALVRSERSSTYRLETFASETTMHQWRRFRYLLKAIDPTVDVAGHRAADVARTAGIKTELGGRMTIPRMGSRRRWRRRTVPRGSSASTCRPHLSATIARPHSMSAFFGGMRNMHRCLVSQLPTGSRGQRPRLEAPRAAPIELRFKDVSLLLNPR